MSRPPVVLDNGTGYTKMGFCGNSEPNFLIPSLISTIEEKKDGKKSDVEDLDFFIGDEAGIKRHNYNLDYPVRQGVVANWDNMEKYWQRCIFQYLRVDPEEHYFLLTEPPLNTPENREFTAEIMFETFNVPGLYIAVQAVLALCAAIFSGKKKAAKSAVTGTVIDSGDGVTHVIPVVEGYVIGSCIKHIPLAGRDITNFVIDTLRARGEPIHADFALEIAKAVKERYSYVCKDLVTEFEEYDKNPSKIIAHPFTHPKSQEKFKLDIGYERFLCPEIFFSPEIFSSDFAVPLPDIVDQSVQACPLDTRRSLYDFVTLSGGSTMFKDFDKRLQRDLKRKLQVRYDATKAKYPDMDIKPLTCNVVGHAFQRFAVWFGGSMLASLPEFIGSFHKKAEYQEKGPRIARSNPVFNVV